MFSVYGSLNGQPSDPLQIDFSQLLEYFPTARLVGGIKPSVSDQSEVDHTYSCVLKSTLTIIMDQTGKKKSEQTYVPMPEFLVNNPNISIYPTTNSSTLQKQLPISINRTSRTITGSVPVSVVPVSSLVNNVDQLTKITDPTETKNCAKRVSSSQITNKQPKQPRFSSNKTTKVSSRVYPALSEKISKFSAVQINQINITDSSSKLLNNVATSSIPSTSSSANKLQDSTFQQPQTNSIDINSKVDSTVDAEKMLNGTATKFQVSNDGQLKTNINQCSSKEMRDSSPSKGFRLEVRTRNSPNDDECYTIKDNELISTILAIIKSKMKSGVTVENQDTSVQCTKIVLSPEHNRLSESKNTSPNLKSTPANHNNIITPTHNPISKQLTTKIDANVKSQRSINVNQLQKSPSKPVAAAIQVSANSKQASTSVSSSKTTKPCDIKNPVSSSQNYTPAKHTMATVTQIQSSNKQINKNQLPSSSTKVVSVTPIPSVTTKKLVAVSHSEKPTIAYQSSLQSVKKCSKCNVLSDDDICTTCLMSSQLKGVTVTRIETPGNDSQIIDLDSDKDEEEEEIVLEDCPSLITEPTITRVETKDQIKKHLDKLSSNPNLLEDKLWHKDLSSKDFFKFDQCHTVQIGSFNTSPVPSGDMIICTHGIRMTVNNTKFDAITIDIPTENIVKIYGNYAETPTLIIYTNYLAAAGIQYLLNMNEKEKNYYYDPVSKDFEQKKIIWNFDIKRHEVSLLEKLLMKLNGKYEALTLAEMRSISFKKSLNKEKENKKLQEGEELDPDAEIFRDTLEGRKVTLRIRDYKLLAIDEFLNDILMEFYMNRWYMRMLSPEDKNRTYVFNTYFYTTLTRKTHTDVPVTESKSKTRHDRVKKWTKNVNIFEKDFIFIPINESFHWYMIVVCFPYLTGPVYMDDGTPVKTPVDNTDYFETRHFTLPSSDAMKSDCDEADGYTENLRHIEPYYHERVGVSYEIDIENLKQRNFRPIKQPCILILDSLYGNAGQICRAKNVATVREWLAEEYRAKYNGAERDFSINVVKGHTVKVPQQTNFTDCGLFVLHFFEKFFQRPIVDYSLPILHLENWFLPDEVQKNCQKRKDVANMIQSIYQEQHSLLPCGAVLPALSFAPKIRGSQNSQQQNRHHHNRHYNDHNEDLENSECDEESEDELDEYDHADESEDYNSHNQCDGYSEEEEEDDYDHDVHDGNVYDYYPEMEDIEDGNDIHSNADYVHVEQDYDEGINNQFNNMNADHENIINVDDSLNGSMSQRNHQHISNANYTLYRQNNLVRSHDDDDDDDEDDFNEEDFNEDGELTQSTSYSNRHNRHFKRRRLSNQ